MTADRPASALRRYVLGAATDIEAATIERDYFKNVETLERVRAAEVDLIDDYVSGQLSGDEHEVFEREYLTTPARRRRVAVARALGKAATARSNERRRSRRLRRMTAGLAAAIAVLAGAGAWLLQTPSDPRTALENASRPVLPATSGTGAIDSPARQAPPVSDARPPDRRPVVATFEISPILVRGGHAAATAIPEGTDVVRLHLQGEPTGRPDNPTTAIVRTVGGLVIWRGSAVASSEPRELARIDVPASRLRPDDYIIELLGDDTRGRRIELHRYFLSVRSP
jgi:hypothetical protein